MGDLVEMGAERRRDGRSGAYPGSLVIKQVNTQENSQLVLLSL